MKYIKLSVIRNVDKAHDDDNITEYVYLFSRFELTFNHEPGEQNWVTVQLKDPRDDVEHVTRIEVGEFYKCTKIIE